MSDKYKIIELPAPQPWEVMPKWVVEYKRRLIQSFGIPAEMLKPGKNQNYHEAMAHQEVYFGSRQVGKRRRAEVAEALATSSGATVFRP